MGRALWVLGHQVTELDTMGDYGMLHCRTPAETPGPPPHHHTDAAEFFYILEGALEVTCDGETRVLNPGDTFNVPVGAVHTFGNPFPEDCSWITAFSPRGFERFFSDIGVPVDEEKARELSVAPERIGRVIADAGSYNMVIDPRVLASGPQ